jgi:hypothetical protein
MNAQERDLVIRAIGHLDTSRYARQAGDVGSAESALDASRRILLRLAGILDEEEPRCVDNPGAESTDKLDERRG